MIYILRNNVNNKWYETGLIQKDYFRIKTHKDIMFLKMSFSKNLKYLQGCLQNLTLRNTFHFNNHPYIC